MANVLFLVHRIPYPPDKGDKVRSFHLLEELSRSHRVFVGSFIDDAADLVHEQPLRDRCAGLYLARLRPRLVRVRSLIALLGKQPMTLHCYKHAGLRKWVQETVHAQGIDVIVVFSSAMAQFAEGFELPVLLDLIDVDSAKWAQYARRHRWPLSWLYARESRTLGHYEREAVAASRHAFLTTEREVSLFNSVAPECSSRVTGLSNGVDAAFFAPDAGRGSPFKTGDRALVFTGAMDYWPNIDAVQWFTRSVFPALRERCPSLRLYIVGRNPTSAVHALAGTDVFVTGTVADVRPYLQHAAVVVAPLRLARGVQNKVLEAMAMARPVVASAACVRSIIAEEGSELVSATTASDFADAIDRLLSDPRRAEAIGAAARRRVLSDYSWTAQLAPLRSALQRVIRPADLRTVEAAA